MGNFAQPSHLFNYLFILWSSWVASVEASCVDGMKQTHIVITSNTLNKVSRNFESLLGLDPRNWHHENHRNETGNISANEDFVFGTEC